MKSLKQKVALVMSVLLLVAAIPFTSFAAKPSSVEVTKSTLYNATISDADADVGDTVIVTVEPTTDYYVSKVEYFYEKVGGGDMTGDASVIPGTDSRQWSFEMPECEPGHKLIVTPTVASTKTAASVFYTENTDVDYEDTKQYYTSGSLVTFKVVPKTGYRVEGVTYRDVKNVHPTTTVAYDPVTCEATFTMPAYDVNVYVESKETETLYALVKKNAHTHGTFKISSDGVYGESLYVPVSTTATPSTIFVEAEPESGYEVEYFRLYDETVGGEDYASPSSTVGKSAAYFDIEQPHTYKVVVAFREKTSGQDRYAIINNVDETNGSVTVVDDAKEGELVTVVYAPDEGYHLDLGSAKVKEVNSLAEIPFTKNGENTFTFTMPDDDVRVYGQFISDEIPKHELTWNLTSMVKVEYQGGEISTGALVEEGATFTVKITPDADKQVAAVTLYKKNSEDVIKTVTDHSDIVEFEGPTCDSRIVVTFEARKEYNITIADTVNGTITTDKAKAKHGDTVLITASPASDYYKVKSKPVVTTENIGAVNVDQASVTEFEFKMPAADVTVSAEFVRNLVGGYYEIKSSVTSFDGHGSIKLAKTKGQCNEEIQFEVLPDEGYKATSISVEATYTGSTEPEVVPYSYAAKLNTYKFDMPTCLNSDGDYVTVYVYFDKADENTHQIYVTPKTLGHDYPDHGDIVADAADAVQGTTVKFEVKADNGYVVRNVEIKGRDTKSTIEYELTKGSLEDKEINFKFVMPDEDVDVIVTYYHTEYKLSATATKSMVSSNEFGTFTEKTHDLSGDPVIVYWNDLIGGSIVPNTGYKIQSAKIIYTDVYGEEHVIDEVYNDPETYDYEFEFPEGDTRIEIVFAPIEYTVEYDVNGGEGTIADTTFYYEATDSQTLSSDTPTRTGYDFVGWNETQVATGSTADYAAGATITTPFTSEEGKIVTLYAVWDPHPYRVVFYPGSASISEGEYDQDFIYDVAQKLLPNTFARTGYLFDGWIQYSGTQTYADEEEVMSLTPVKNAAYDLKAQWKPIDYTVKFDGNGATSGTMDDMAFKYDAAQNLTANAFVKTGYYFTGWKLGSVDYADQANVVNLTTTHEDTLTFVAQWSPNPYTVEFQANGGTGATQSQAYEYDTAQALKTFETLGFAKTGYHYLGWSATGEAPATYTNGQTVSNLTTEKDATVAMKAVWEANPYKVQFNANGATGTMADQSFTYDQAQNLTANGFTKTGYHFTGWSVDGIATASYVDEESVINLTAVNGGTFDLYAMWEANEYTVVYNGNGGSGYMADQAFTYDEPQALTANAFYRPDWTFRGWVLTAEAKDVVYTNGQVVSNLTAEDDGNVTLFARWMYTPTTSSSGGGGGGGTVTTTKTTTSTYSKFWVQQADGSWVVQYPAGNTITRTWFCDDAVSGNGKNVWYLLGNDGRMITAGLVQDASGNFYSIETESNGYKGMLRYKDGWYNCNGTMVYIEFVQDHGGAFGAIKNQDAIDKLKAIYGVTQYGVSSTNCQYSSQYK